MLPLFRELATAFEHGGLDSLMDEYAARRSAPGLAWLMLRALELVLPVPYLAEHARVYDQLIAELGVAGASSAMLRRWRLAVKYDVAPGVLQVLTSGAFVAFGNHPTGIEGVAFASLVDRDDVYRVVASFFPKLGQNLGRQMLLVQATASGPTDGRRGLPTKAYGFIEALIWPVRPLAETRDTNRRALRNAAELVVRGGGVHIFPAGSPRDQSRWRAGLGMLVSSLVAAPPDGDCYVVPIRYEIRLHHLLASAFFPRRHPLRLACRLLSQLDRRQPRVVARVAVPIGRLGLQPDDAPPQVTARLEQLWGSMR